MLYDENQTYEERVLIEEHTEGPMDKIKGFGKKTVQWCKDHKEVIIVFGPIILGGGIEIGKMIAKRELFLDEKALKERFIYDRKKGHYYEMTRKPKGSEWIQIDHRIDYGEMLGDILSDMKLLKK